MVNGTWIRWSREGRLLGEGWHRAAGFHLDALARHHLGIFADFIGVINPH